MKRAELHEINREGVSRMGHQLAMMGADLPQFQIGAMVNAERERMDGIETSDPELKETMLKLSIGSLRSGWASGMSGVSDADANGKIRELANAILDLKSPLAAVLASMLDTQYREGRKAALSYLQEQREKACRAFAYHI